MILVREHTDMNAITIVKRAQGVVECTRGGRLAVVIVGLGFLGCAGEHRISLAEFQQRVRAAPSAAEETPSQTPPINVDDHLGPYRVGPGDVINVVLHGEAPIPALQTRVNRSGEIDLPLVGRIKVGDMELEDVEDAIRSALVPGVLTEVLVYVELVDVGTTNVLVVGAVSDPGLIPLRRTERNMLYAIAAAGGMSELASGRATLRRIRSPEEAVTFDLRDPVQLQRAIALKPLDAGDMIDVQSAKPNTVFVGGLVARAGPQTYPVGSEVTILQVLAAAGGVRTDIFPREGTLIRRMPDGKDAHVKLNLNRLALGQDPNITLIAGDILWIPETWDTRVESFINQNFFLRAGVSVNYNISGVEFLNRRGLQARRTGGGTQESFDPLGFLSQNAALQGIQGSLATQQ